MSKHLDEHHLKNLERIFHDWEREDDEESEHKLANCAMSYVPEIIGQIRQLSDQRKELLEALQLMVGRYELSDAIDDGLSNAAIIARAAIARAEGENPDAFPFDSRGEADFAGMTLRDYFAAKAMATLAASKWYDGRMDAEGVADVSPNIAIDAYAMADAMLEKRMKP